MASHAQNLVVDCSFEDTLDCPTPISGSYAQYLLKYCQYSISANYFNSCENTINHFSTPQNFAGFANPLNGQGYAGIVTYLNDSIPLPNTYLVGVLLDTLKQNKKYKIKLFISLADSMKFICNNLSIYFSDTIPTYFFDSSNHLQLNLTHEPEINFNKDLSNKSDWIILDTTYIATGYEKYFMIGNFLADSISDTTNISGGLVSSNSIEYYHLAYYYIDDVSVELVDETGLSTTSSMQNLGFKVMPNPSNGSFVLEGNNNNVLNVSIQNTAGALLYNKNMQPQNKQVKIDDAALAKGVYFVKVTTEFGMQCLKLVVQ